MLGPSNSLLMSTIIGVTLRVLESFGTYTSYPTVNELGQYPRCMVKRLGLQI